MSFYFRYLHTILLFSATVFASACSITAIGPKAVPQAAEALSQLGNSPIRVTVAPLPSPIVIGRQFAFVLLPAGRIELQRGDELLYNEIYTALAERDFKIIPWNDFGVPGEIIISDAAFSANAWDLLIRRRVTASASFTMVRSGASERRCAGATSAWRKFGFEQEIKELIIAAISEAIRGCADYIELARPVRR